MIISRTPFRISFFGGGTDYPTWYREHGGEVLGTSINKYCYLTCRFLPPFFEHRYRIVYSMMENRTSVDDIVHSGVRETIKYLGITRGLEIHHDADLPARSGMGSSSAFVVGLLHALYGLQGQMRSKQQLAEEAIHIEQECIGDTVGSQDQVLAAFGGLNRVVFASTGAITVQPVTIAAARMHELDSHLMLFFTGINRIASDVAKTFVGRANSEQQIRTLGAQARDGLRILGGTSDIDDFGRLMHEAWQAKRALSPAISSDEIDDLYAKAHEAGAIGGKVIGAGGGGFMLFFVPPDRHAHVREALHQLIHVPFSFDSTGTQIIYFDQQEEYGDAERDREGRRVASFREASRPVAPAPSLG